MNTCTCAYRHDGDDAGLVPPDPPCPDHGKLEGNHLETRHLFENRGADFVLLSLLALAEWHAAAEHRGRTFDDWGSITLDTSSVSHGKSVFIVQGLTKKLS